MGRGRGAGRQLHAQGPISSITTWSLPCILGPFSKANHQWALEVRLMPWWQPANSRHGRGEWMLHSSCPLVGQAQGTFFMFPQRVPRHIDLQVPWIQNLFLSTAFMGFPTPLLYLISPLPHYHFLGSNSNKLLIPKTLSEALLLGETKLRQEVCPGCPISFYTLTGSTCDQMRFVFLNQHEFWLHILLFLVIPQLYSLSNSFTPYRNFSIVFLFNSLRTPEFSG